MGASWGQSPDAREAAGISTSRDVCGVLRLKDYRTRLIEAR
jgi:hypothetical protein